MEDGQVSDNAMTAFIAPTEPALLRALGKVSPAFETAWGCDVFWPEHAAGLQRKTVEDFISSVNTDHLATQIQKMKQLKHAFLLIEGRMRFTSDGELVGNQWARMNRRMFTGLLLSIQAAGVKVLYSDDISDTVEMVQMVEKWLSKPNHSWLNTRSKQGVESDWGSPGNRDWLVFLLSSFPSINHVLANRMIDTLGAGRLLGWIATAEELLSVPGLGELRVKRLLGSLGRGIDGKELEPMVRRVVKKRVVKKSLLKKRAAVGSAKQASGKDAASVGGKLKKGKSSRSSKVG